MGQPGQPGSLPRAGSPQPLMQFGPIGGRIAPVRYPPDNSAITKLAFCAVLVTFRSSSPLLLACWPNAKV